MKRWKLKETFADAIARANPQAKMKRLRPGQTLQIPNPAAYIPGRNAAPRATKAWRWYEIQVGDRLETIARTHLGKRSRWTEIRDLNPGLNPKKIRAGQRIKLPAR